MLRAFLIFLLFTTISAQSSQINAVLERMTSLENRLKNATSALERKIEQMDDVADSLETLVQRFNASLQAEPVSSKVSSNNGDTQGAASCVGGVIYEDLCIRLPYTTIHGSANVRLSQAAEICSQKHCGVAEISSDHMYDVVVEYIRSTWNFPPRYYYVRVWLGSTFDTPRDNSHHLITLASGRKITLTRWLRLYPSEGYPAIGKKGMAMWVNNKNSTHNDHGIYNLSPTFRLEVPLCVYKRQNV